MQPLLYGQRPHLARSVRRISFANSLSAGRARHGSALALSTARATFGHRLEPFLATALRVRSQAPNNAERGTFGGKAVNIGASNHCARPCIIKATGYPVSRVASHANSTYPQVNRTSPRGLSPPARVVKGGGQAPPSAHQVSCACSVGLGQRLQTLPSVVVFASLYPSSRQKQAQAHNETRVRALHLKALSSARCGVSPT